MWTTAAADETAAGRGKVASGAPPLFRVRRSLGPRIKKNQLDWKAASIQQHKNRAESIRMV